MMTGSLGAVSPYRRADHDCRHNGSGSSSLPWSASLVVVASPPTLAAATV
eukprot:CAMPEP_0206312238 /NCGR_PEP_ID=MMETSP0106_2-20121207/13885_1 /ASSEMBLY_ACC=CAM_ASM_000206 /TAXON_ID=81532 /ORGANISM="Acanthoeca-like sp., Strain 10tr" /LENGTH=49 /DNA_ID= /DNA_START= /DNA_END= /DNA_ORIENTATION=